MVHGEAKITELKSKAFQLVERLNAGVDVDLFSKTVISVVSDKHHGHPVIAGVTRNLFRVSTTYYFHNFCISCRVFEGQAECLPHATKK